MKDYEVIIKIDRLLHYSASLKPDISNETLLMIIRSFSSYVRDMYKAMILEFIYSKKYKGSWEPVEEEGYIEYLGVPPSDTDIVYLMYEALEIREIKNNIIIRFDPKYLYPGSRIPLIKVLKAIDNGTSKFNARPVLRPIVRQLNSSIPELWRLYLKQRGVA